MLHRAGLEIKVFVVGEKRFFLRFLGCLLETYLCFFITGCQCGEIMLIKTPQKMQMAMQVGRESGTMNFVVSS